MWSSITLPAVALLAALANQATAQVTSDCNPLNVTDCPPNPAFGMDYTFHFNTTPPTDAWETHVRGIEYSQENGAAFAINKRGDSPTLRSKFYFFGGRTEIILKTAPGKGIVSSMMWLSDTLDEVDWEFVGTDTNIAQSNYFGKGEEIYTEGEMHEVPGAPISEDFHNYTCTWTEERLEWWIDGNRVRVLNRADALENGHLYPQTPMRLYLGIWAGGDPDMPEGTREWAGGEADYDNGPYTMYVKAAHVTDYSTGKEYSYGDQSGSWESINIVDEGKNSTIQESLMAEPEKSLGEKFNDLPDGAKYGIYGGGAFVGAALLAALILYIIRQRRRGAAEAAAAEKRAEIERQENEDFAKSGINPDGFAGVTGAEYNPSNPQNEYRRPSYDAPPPSSPTTAGAYGAAAGAAAGAGAYGAMRSVSKQSSPNDYDTNDYDGMRSPSSPTAPAAAYGAMRSPSSPTAPPAAYGSVRSPSSPAPSVHGYGQMRSPSAPPQNAYESVRSPSSPAPSAHGYGQMRSPASPAPSAQGYGQMRSPSAPPQNAYGSMRSPSSPAPSAQGYGQMRSPSSPAPSAHGYGAPPPRGPQTFGDMNMGNNRYYR